MRPGPPPVITVKPNRAHAASDFARDGVARMGLAESGGSEDGHARPDEMEHPKTADEIARGPCQQLNLLQARVRTGKHHAIGGAGRRGLGRIRPWSLARILRSLFLRTRQGFHRGTVRFGVHG